MKGNFGFPHLNITDAMLITFWVMTSCQCGWVSEMPVTHILYLRHGI